MFSVKVGEVGSFSIFQAYVGAFITLRARYHFANLGLCIRFRLDRLACHSPMVHRSEVTICVTLFFLRGSLL